MAGRMPTKFNEPLTTGQGRCWGYFGGPAPVSPSATSGRAWVAVSTAVAAVWLTPATLPATESRAGAAPSMTPVADSVTVAAAVVAESPIEPRSAGSPGISSPVASFTLMRAFLIVSHMGASFRLECGSGFSEVVSRVVEGELRRWTIRGAGGGRTPAGALHSGSAP